MLLGIYNNQQKLRWFVMNNKITSLPLPNHHMFERAIFSRGHLLNFMIHYVHLMHFGVQRLIDISRSSNRISYRI